MKCHNIVSDETYAQRWLFERLAELEILQSLKEKHIGMESAIILELKWHSLGHIHSLVYRTEWRQHYEAAFQKRKFSFPSIELEFVKVTDKT